MRSLNSNPNPKLKATPAEPFLPERRRLVDPLCRVALIEPCIPANTGNIARTCVGTGSELHLIEPLGFELSEGRLKRAGLDYWSHLALDIHKSFHVWADCLRSEFDLGRVFFFETWGTTSLHDASFQRGDWLVFGKETTGLEREQVESLIQAPEQVLCLPMPGEIRSLNLSNAAAVSVFELMRQVSSKK